MYLISGDGIDSQDFPLTTSIWVTPKLIFWLQIAWRLHKIHLPKARFHQSWYSQLLGTLGICPSLHRPSPSAQLQRVVEQFICKINQTFKFMSWQKLNCSFASCIENEQFKTVYQTTRMFYKKKAKRYLLVTVFANAHCVPLWVLTSVTKKLN